MNTIEKEVTRYMITTDVNSAEAIEATKSLVQTINEGGVQEKLIYLIQELGEYLTNDDEFVRAKATGLLSQTLVKCDNEAINDSAVSVLIDFYCDRLTDTTCVPNLLEGLEALTKFSKFTGKNAVLLSKRLFEHVKVQQYPQGARYSAFMIFNNMIQNQSNALKSINNEFVYGFTQVLDGEKDPRNLMAAFDIMTSIVEKFDISSHVEDIFEVTFCYFPITFKPPPDDPYGISADDLKSSLRRCISSTALFSKFALPLILEKLSSTSGSAKKDSMETLAACAPIYQESSLLPSLNEIFSSLKVEVFHSIETPLEDAAVEAIQAVVSTLSDPTATQTLIEECATHLKDPDMKDSKQAGRIIRAVASGSDHASRFVVAQIAPLVLRQYRETNVATLKKANVDIMIDLLEANTTVLLEYKDRFFGIFQFCLTSSNEYNLLRLSGLTGLKLMIMSKGYLEPNEIGIAVQSLNDVLLKEEDEELVSAALNALAVAAELDSLYINQITIPSLIDRIQVKSVSNHSRLLYALKTLLPVPSVYKFAMPLLIDTFDLVCQEDDVSYALAIINCILNIVKQKSNDKHKDLAESINTFIPHFIIKAVEATFKSTLILNHSVLEKVALILILLFTKSDSSAQKTFVDRLFKLYVNGDLAEFNIEPKGTFKPFSEGSDEQKETCQLFAAIVVSLRKDVILPIPSLVDYLNELVSLALSSTHPTQITSASRMLGSLINKWKDNSALTEYVKTTAVVLEDVIVKPNTNSQNALEAYLWITKGLVLRTHALGYELTNTIIGWCQSNVIGSKAPKGFSILIGDDELALTKTAFATTTILYKQRFFSFCLPKLVEGFRTSSNEIKPNFLIALSYILKNVPQQILLSELPPLVPLLIESLQLEDPELKVSTLETFKLAVQEAPTVIGPKTSTILPSLTQLLNQPAIQVRIATIECLAAFPGSISNDALKPHVSFVIQQLKTPLDDKKRKVRKEAVDCRSKWYTIKV